MGAFVQPGLVKVKVVNPSCHWDPAIGHGEHRYDHQTDADGNVFVLVPREVAQVLHCRVDGYEIANG